MEININTLKDELAREIFNESNDHDIDFAIIDITISDGKLIP